MLTDREPDRRPAEHRLGRVSSSGTHLLCRCKFRSYTTCTNRATQEDGLCDPCRRDGGDGHPKAVTDGT